MKVEYRKGSRGPRRGRKANPLVALLLILAMALLFTYSALYILDSRIRPVLEEIGGSNAQSMVNLAIARAVEEELARGDISYADMISIEKDSSGNVKTLSTNMVKLNQIKSRLNERVEATLNGKTMYISIPAGNLLNVDLFSGHGPLVDFKLLPFGSVNVDITNHFTEAGINQTLHQIYLQVRANVTLVLPVSNITSVVESNVCIGETVIVGTVPDSYTQVTGGGDWLENKIIDYQAK